MKENVTIKVDQTLLEIIRDHYTPYFTDTIGEYVDFQAKTNGVVITAYLSKKDTRKITFVGTSLLEVYEGHYVRCTPEMQSKLAGTSPM